MTHNRKPFAIAQKRKDKAIDETKTSFIDIPSDVIKYIGSFLAKNKDKNTYATLCKTTNNFFQPDLDEDAFIQLLQAVMDGNRAIIKHILDRKPELLLRTPKKGQIVESHLTWQRFYAEKPLEMATKRKQREVIEYLLPYFNELQKRGFVQDGAKEALAQWKICELSSEAKKELRQKYELKMKALIDIIAKETFPHGTEKDRLIDRISEETKTTLEEFRKELLPDNAVTLDNYPDVEQLLIAGYKAYIDHFNVFHLHHWDLGKLYCIAVLGFIQTMLTPELSKAFCQHLNDNKISYYHFGRDSHSGLGFDFFVGMHAGISRDPLSRIVLIHSAGGECSWLKQLCQAKTDELDQLQKELMSGHLPQHASKKRRPCVVQ